MCEFGVFGNQAHISLDFRLMFFLLIEQFETLYTDVVCHAEQD